MCIRSSSALLVIWAVLLLASCLYAGQEKVGATASFAAPPNTWHATNASGPSRRHYTCSDEMFKWKSPNNTADEELSVGGEILVGEYLSFKGAMSIDIALKNASGLSVGSMDAGGFKGKMTVIEKPGSFLIAWTGKDANGGMLEFLGSAYYSLAHLVNESNRDAATADLKDRMAKLVADIRASLSSISSTAKPPTPPAKPKDNTPPQTPKPKPKPPTAQPRTALLNILIETNQGTSWVENAKVVVRNLNTNKALPEIVVKQRDTYIKINVTNSAKPLKLQVESVTIPENAVYHLPMGEKVPAGLKKSVQLPVKLGKKAFALSSANNFEANFRAEVPLCPLLVTVSKWDNSAGEYAPYNANLYLRGQQTKAVLLAMTEMALYKETGAVTLYVPSSEVLGAANTSYSLVGIDPTAPPSQKIKDTRNVPTLSGSAAAAPVHLQLIDPVGRLQEWGNALREKLADTDKILGGKIASIEFITDNPPSWVKSADVSCYLDGKMWIAGSFDQTDPDAVRDIMHEWGHHIAWAQGVEAGRGSGETGSKGHEVWDASSRDLAWDEARAHFFSEMLPSVIPNAPTKKNDLTEAEALKKASMKPTAAHQAPGELVEGAVATALLDCYSGQKMTRQEIIQNFISTQQQAKDAGTPIMNANAFIDFIESKDPSKKAGLEQLRRKYRLVK